MGHLWKCLQSAGTSPQAALKQSAICQPMVFAAVAVVFTGRSYACKSVHRENGTMFCSDLLAAWAGRFQIACRCANQRGILFHGRKQAQVRMYGAPGMGLPRGCQVIEDFDRCFAYANVVQGTVRVLCSSTFVRLRCILSWCSDAVWEASLEAVLLCTQHAKHQQRI